MGPFMAELISKLSFLRSNVNSLVTPLFFLFSFCFFHLYVYMHSVLNTFSLIAFHPLFITPPCLFWCPLSLLTVLPLHLYMCRCM